MLSSSEIIRICYSVKLCKHDETSIGLLFSYSVLSVAVNVWKVWQAFFCALCVIKKHCDFSLSDFKWWLPKKQIMGN